MSSTNYTFNRYHLGDNLIFLHLLRSLAKANVSVPFVHFCHACYIGQLHEVVVDLPNILLEPFESPLWGQHQHAAIDTWKNAEGFWERSKVRWDWSAHTLEHHKWTADRMGFTSPLTCQEHLLFDYTAIQPYALEFSTDFLIGDSAPSSGQYKEWADHSKHPMRKLIDALVEKNHFVGFTSRLHQIGDSISKIGLNSLHSKNHIMVANGPFWATMNVHNHHAQEGRKRIVLLDNGEQLNMPHIIQMSSISEVMKFAENEGWV